LKGEKAGDVKRMEQQVSETRGLKEQLADAAITADKLRNEVSYSSKSKGAAS
jgi:hypothetical protein